MKVRKAVIPAAGLGTRFLPITKTVPKEMLPLLDRPVIQEVIEEAVLSGIRDIVLVTGMGKSSIEDISTFPCSSNVSSPRRGKTLCWKGSRRSRGWWT